MNLLLLDSSGPVCGVALWRDGELAHEIVACHGQRQHAQTLLPLAEQALAAASLRAGDIDIFAAVVGPGSFTGVRIGVSTARALAHATGARCLAVNALEALAMNGFGFSGADATGMGATNVGATNVGATNVGATNVGATGVGATNVGATNVGATNVGATNVVATILDARAGQVYGAAFAPGCPPVRLMDDCALPFEEFCARLPAGPVLFVGDGLRAHALAARELCPGAVIAPAAHAYLRPACAAQLAALSVDRAVGFSQLTPLYLRAPQAERERARKLATETGHP